MLLEHNVNPIMVFDGARLPSKKSTEEKRRKNRDMFRERGMKLLREGKRKEANDNFKHCIDVKPEYALNLINACRERGIQCIVAPYEADAQLAYMIRSGMAYAVISEDSDLLVFGCERVLFKMDDVGNGFLINLREVGNVKAHNMLGFGEDSFRHMCILSGCDYLDSVPGVGLITAHKLMRKYGFDPYKVIQSLRCERSKTVPAEYEDNFKQADMTFLFQVVFDPRAECQVHLTPVPPELQNCALTYAGTQVTPKKAKALARGNINPITNAVMGDYTPSKDGRSLQRIGSGVVEKHQKTMTSFFATGGGRSSKRSRQEEPEMNPEVVMKQYVCFNPKSIETINSMPPLKSKRNIFSTDSSNAKAFVYSRFFSKPSRDGLIVNEQPTDKNSNELLPDISKLRKLCYQVERVDVADSQASIDVKNQFLFDVDNFNNNNVNKESPPEARDNGDRADKEISPDLLNPCSPPFVLSPDLLAGKNESQISYCIDLHTKSYDEEPLKIQGIKETKQVIANPELNLNGKQITSNQIQDPYTTPSKDSHTLCIIPETPASDTNSQSKSDDSDIELSSLTYPYSQPIRSHYFSKRSNLVNYRRPLTGCGRPKRRPLTGPNRQLALDVFATKTNN